MNPTVEEPHVTTPLRLAVAINPRAAFGGRGNNTPTNHGERTVAALRAAGHVVTVLRRHDYAALREAVDAELAAGADGLVVVGGDGMVHLGVNATAGKNIPLGIIPTGTGNDAARGLGLDPHEPLAAVDHLVHRLQLPPRRIDAGRIDGTGFAPRWFVCALSAGFDALVNERANGWRWPRGPMRYNLAILRELWSLRARRYELVVDGVPRSLDALLISVANGPSIGGGMKITPEARYDDGQLDLFVVAPVRRLTFLRIFPLVFSGRHTAHPVVSIERVRSVSLATDGVVGYADGERMAALPLEVTVDPGALLVWV